MSNSPQNYSNIVSSLALATSILALGWNIVRDLVKDKIAIEFFIAFGEKGNFENSMTDELFSDAGSLLPTHKFDNPATLIKIINVGRKQIAIASVGGKFKNGNHFVIATQGLPKMLSPYEVFASLAPARPEFIKNIHAGEIDALWVSDTAGKDWFLSEVGWNRLKRTADYIALSKHL